MLCTRSWKLAIPAALITPSSPPLSSHSSLFSKPRPEASREPNGPHTENTAWWRSRGGGDPGPRKYAGQTHTSAVLCLVIGLTIRASQCGRREISSGFDLICPECRHRRGRSCRGESRTVHPTKVSQSMIHLCSHSLPPRPPLPMELWDVQNT